eukprot:TRINITY_DN80537_c0_g1_i1.p1 TRINITY_DN80537_c0_g1~~TRINITY_DN80537_c0_g1_i1.p1  ORF type:complete len:918 (-),score=122.58 TRINITY_DN80537_c0_g1_i1:27-2780(-)
MLRLPTFLSLVSLNAILIVNGLRAEAVRATSADQPNIRVGRPPDHPLQRGTGPEERPSGRADAVSPAPVDGADDGDVGAAAAGATSQHAASMRMANGSTVPLVTVEPDAATRDYLASFYNYVSTMLSPGSEAPDVAHGSKVETKTARQPVGSEEALKRKKKGSMMAEFMRHVYNLGFIAGETQDASSRDTILGAAAADKQGAARPDVPTLKTGVAVGSEEASHRNVPSHVSPPARHQQAEKVPMSKTTAADKTVHIIRGSDIWEAGPWGTVADRHAAGIRSNIQLKKGALPFSNAPYFSYPLLLMLTVVVYPGALVVLVLFAATVLRSCLKEQAPRFEEAVGNPQEEAPEVTSSAPGGNNLEATLTPEQLTPFSQELFAWWVSFCRFVPVMFVIGVPLLLLLIAPEYPQEVYALLVLMPSALVMCNASYIFVFGIASVSKLNSWADRNFSLECSERQRAAGGEAVTHWLILPQYKEDIGTVSMALESVAASSIARCSISICFAMEEREAGSRQKASDLSDAFKDRFKEITASFHPPNLPNDPPGKASNVAWAFRHLSDHLRERGQDQRNVVLTICDADSEFHAQYFEAVTCSFWKIDREERYRALWQAPIMHMKNYHRQPAPVVAGTALTCINDLACLSDPHRFHCPYSTYSLPMALATEVGGWDPEWIGEDWHMGIKCNLRTGGETKPQAIFLPVVNYTPEETSWNTTVWARWVQAKRHALGFSDVAYVLMQFPLLLSSRRSSKRLSNRHLIQVCLPILVRLVNVHVILGVFATYGVMASTLRFLMLTLLEDLPGRQILRLFVNIGSYMTPVYLMNFAFQLVLVVMFVRVYSCVRKRVEGEAFFGNRPAVHWLYVAFTTMVFGPFYFLCLGIASCNAALGVWLLPCFEYEVASKPQSQATGGSKSPTCSTCSSARS